jgi:DNA-binding beta-propeller fold protein YncE
MFVDRLRHTARQLATAPALLAVALALGSTAGRADAATPRLVQKPGAGACLSSSGPCTRATAVEYLQSVTISPDGRSAYLAGGTALGQLDRTPDGTLSQRSGATVCFSDQTFGTASCASGAGLDDPGGVAVSPDGRNVYVASGRPGGTSAVAVFDRAGDGALTQKVGLAGCIADVGSASCVDGVGLDDAHTVKVSPDGANVYVAGPFGGIAVFDRAADGTLTQKPGLAGCVSDTGSGPCADGRGLGYIESLAISPDGRSVYTTARMSEAVAVLDRGADGTLTQKPGVAGCISASTTGGECAFGKAFSGPDSVAVSPDGANVYVGADGSDAVSSFDRAADGSLTQKAGSAGCISGRDSGGACANGVGLDGVIAVTVSPDGASVYSAGYTARGAFAAVLDRAADGTLSQPSGAAGCFSENALDGCTLAAGLADARSVTVSPDGRSAYVAGSAVAVFDRKVLAPPPAPDVTQPLLRGLSLTPARFRASARGASVVARGGTRISYRLSEPAAVTFRVQRVLAGRRAGGRCVAATARNRSARRCDRYRTLAGSFTHAGATGANALRFSGRLRNRPLVVGRYRLSGVASDAARNRSADKVVRFEIRGG